MDTKALYLDPEELCVHPENQDKKLLEISMLSVGKVFGDDNILTVHPQLDKALSNNKELKKSLKVTKTYAKNGKNPFEGLLTPKEPHSVITCSSTEVVYLSRKSFAECLTGGGKTDGKDDLTHFVNCQQYYPDDENLRRMYYEETNWQDFKGQCGKIYKNMRQTP